MISVLYVDDETSLLEIMKLFLERTGEFSVDTAESASIAITMLKEKSYDVVVSDYQMPGMDGIEFLKVLRKENPMLPFIIFTGKGREEIAIQAFESGADFYIQKGGAPRPQFTELSHKIRKSVEHRNAEQHLRESETRFRSLIQNTSDIIRILDRDNRIVYDSPAASRILGYPENYFIGKDPADFIHPDDRARVISALAKVMEGTNNGMPTEFRIRKGNGEYIDVESVAMNLLGVKGVDGIVITTRVITERKHGEQALRESEEKFRDLFDNGPNGYYSVGIDGRITQCNYQAGVILGTPCESLIRQKISDYYANTKSGKEKARQILEAFRNGKEIVDEELQMKKTDGSLIWVHLTLNAIRNASGIIIGSRTTITDITRKKQHEQLILDLTQHDAKNKITVMRSYLCLIRENVRNPALCSYIDKIDSMVNELSEQIEFTRAYQNLGLKSPQWQDVTHLIHKIPAGSLRINTKVDGLKILADPLLGNVFYNLLENAVRHGEKVTTITVKSHETDSGLVLVWEDNGAGVQKDEKEKIFDRGFGKNTGLGLFLIREILSITDIMIEENGTPGEGARFEITVPRGAYGFHRNQ